MERRFVPTLFVGDRVTGAARLRRNLGWNVSAYDAMQSSALFWRALQDLVKIAPGLIPGRRGLPHVAKPRQHEAMDLASFNMLARDSRG